MPEKKSYKVLLEAVTQGKKKLRSSITYHETAPSGYTFVPVGMPELTDYCKELSRKRGVDVRIVSARPHNLAMHDPTHISHHIHRIGYHFRNAIVDTACVQMGLNTTSGGRPYQNPKDAVGPDAMARRMDVRGKEMGLQMHKRIHDSDAQKEAASRAIRDLFPKIPDDDRRAVVARAFEEGAGRIGEQKDIPLSRRVQLAVTAHIRHTKTDYDNLLKQINWGDARRIVEQGTLDQIIQWRGEGNDDDGELEEILEEVIVLDDVSEDEDDGHQEGENEVSVDILSRQQYAAELDTESPLQAPNYGRSQARNRVSPNIISVRPMRIPRPPQIITQEALQQRMHDSRARVGYSNARERSRDCYVLAPEYQANTYERREEIYEQPRARLRPANDVSPRIATYAGTQHGDRPDGRFAQAVESHTLPLESRPFLVPNRTTTAWQSPDRLMMRNGDHGIRPSVEAPQMRRSSPRETFRTPPGLSMPLGREQYCADVVGTPLASYRVQARAAPAYVPNGARMGHDSSLDAAAPLTGPLPIQHLAKDVIDLTDDSPPSKKRETRDPRYHPYSRSSNLATRRSASPELVRRRGYFSEAPTPSRKMAQSYGAEHNQPYRDRPDLGGPNPRYKTRAPSPHTFYEIMEERGGLSTMRRDHTPVHANEEPRQRLASRPERVLQGYDEYVKAAPAREEQLVYVPVQQQPRQPAFASRQERYY